MNREAAERLRLDDDHWHLGVIYRCPGDPRVIVRNRFPIGWAWNFGHRFVVPALLLAVLVVIGLPALVAASVATATWQVALTFLVALALVVYVAHRIALGPT